MRYKLSQITEALEFFRYNSSIDGDNATIEISVREENIESGSLLGVLTLSTEVEKAEESYSRYSGNKTVKYSLEVFPHHEGRPPTLTTQESQLLIKKR